MSWPISASLFNMIIVHIPILAFITFLQPALVVTIGAVFTKDVSR